MQLLGLGTSQLRARPGAFCDVVLSWTRLWREDQSMGGMANGKLLQYAAIRALPHVSNTRLRQELKHALCDLLFRQNGAA